MKTHFPDLDGTVDRSDNMLARALAFAMRADEEPRGGAAVTASEAAVEVKSLAMDEESFRALYERTARPLWAYLERVSGDAALADDLLQECYCRLLAAAKPPQEAAHQKNYLFRIATNLLRDHWRQAQRRGTASALTAGAAADDPAVENVPLRSDLGRALAQLKPNERQLLWLAYAEGASHKEIAERSGLKSASIRPLLYRARKKLVALMGP
ncbi:MAG TPA: RNA polymerase sigma factor [Terriglobia bacterium]|nr:RNA polymerase sigma factor [Terriglobia bacterium]